MAATTTATRRLTMFYGDVRQRLGDVVALVDGVLEVLEDLLLAEEHLRVDAGVVEKHAHGAPEDGVAFLLELADAAAVLDELLVGVRPEVREHRRELLRAEHEGVDELHHRLRRPLHAEELAGARR